MELLIRSTRKTRILPTMDLMGRFPIQISLVGHQTQWGGGEHLSPRQIGEARMPTLTLPLHPSYGCARSYARRPSFRGGKSGLPRRRKNHGPDLRGRHNALFARHA